MQKKINIMLLLLVTILISAGSNIFARPDGVSGYTLKSGNSGCGTCHGTHGDPNNLVKVEISGPATLKTGETGNYKVKISGGTGQKVGVNIASSDGKLVNADNNLKTMNGELTHSSAKKFSSGSYTFSFKYTAPNTPGTQTLYGTGLSSKPQWNFAQNFDIQVEDITADINNNNIILENYSLSQNFPNPFNPASKISYSLPKESNVKLIIYNSLGEVIQELVNGTKPSGTYEATFDATHYSSGTYFYSLEAVSLDGEENYKLVKKMSLIK